MNVILVDSSSWISYFKGQGHPDIDLALEEGRVLLSPIVASELLSSQLKKKERIDLIDFLNELPLTDSSLDHWIRVGTTRAELLQKGLKISTPDSHIAQCCLDLNCFLLSEDKIFQKVCFYKPLRLYEN